MKPRHVILREPHMRHLVDFPAVRALSDDALRRLDPFMAFCAARAVRDPAEGDYLAYGASKAAIIGMTKAVAADFVRDGIRCNAVCPGTVESPSLRERLGATGDFDKAHAAFTARQPMGRFGTPEEIAEVVCYLAGDLSAFTTGQAFAIDGGWSI